MCCSFNFVRNRFYFKEGAGCLFSSAVSVSLVSSKILSELVRLILLKNLAFHSVVVGWCLTAAIFAFPWWLKMLQWVLPFSRLYVEVILQMICQFLKLGYHFKIYSGYKSLVGYMCIMGTFSCSVAPFTYSYWYALERNFFFHFYKFPKNIIFSHGLCILFPI